MTTERKSEKVFTYIKTDYGGTVLVKTRKLKKTMIKFYLILIIYDFLFVIITAKFYQNSPTEK